MPLQLSPLAVVDLAAGAFIIAVGVFVLVQRAGGTIARVFCLFAVLDGVATILFRLRRMTDEPVDAYFFHGTYWWFQVGALGALAALAVLFPYRPRSSSARRLAIGVIVLGTLAALALYAASPSLFWTASHAPEGLRFRSGTGAWLIAATYAGVTAWVVLRMLHALRADASSTHRLQASFVLGGIALGYAPASTTLLATALVREPSRLGASWSAMLAHVAFALVFLVVVWSGVEALRARGWSRGERRVVGGSMLAVLLLTLASFAGLGSVGALQTVAVAAYPAFLAYAILRFAVFDIEEKVRFATAVAVASAIAGATFVLAETVLQEFLQGRLGAGEGMMAAIVAGLLAAAALVPGARIARRLSARLVPGVGENDLHARKLEIYQHALTGASRDGLTPDESAILAELRRSLGITEEEHRRLAAWSG